MGGGGWIGMDMDINTPNTYCNKDSTPSCTNNQFNYVTPSTQLGFKPTVPQNQATGKPPEKIRKFSEPRFW